MSDVTITVHCEIGGQREVSMPGVTAVKYAAKRAAEAFEFDGEHYWGLVTLTSGNQGDPPLIPDDDVIAEYADVFMGLVIRKVAGG